MPLPEQEGSTRLEGRRQVRIRFDQKFDLHVRHMSVFIGIDRKKIGIHKLDVFCGRSGEHHFEGLEALAISLECKDLSLILHESATSMSSEERESTGTLVRLITLGARFYSRERQWHQLHVYLPRWVVRVPKRGNTRPCPGV